ncbi:hypothetical protein M885DRAFT_518412 [Pelagophyceae sp. CCMP2097]|nr:hypothetical protein M885DRAFT_518412 [Pelagophyceae sp. CCMP2097]
MQSHQQFEAEACAPLREAPATSEHGEAEMDLSREAGPAPAKVQQDWGLVDWELSQLSGASGPRGDPQDFDQTPQTNGDSTPPTHDAPTLWAKLRELILHHTFAKRAEDHVDAPTRWSKLRELVALHHGRTFAFEACDGKTRWAKLKTLVHEHHGRTFAVRARDRAESEGEVAETASLQRWAKLRALILLEHGRTFAGLAGVPHTVDYAGVAMCVGMFCLKSFAIIILL